MNSKLSQSPSLHPYRAVIAPRPAGERRPLWSVMIPTYHCAGFLEEALRSVLAQDPGPDMMQIEVVDDGSTRDDPARVAAAVGHGRVKFYRQAHNVGHCRNFDTCLQRARGQLVHLLHGDDAVRMGFYDRLQRALIDNPGAGAAFCRYISFDEAGRWLNISPVEQPAPGILRDWLPKIAAGQRLQPPCMVVRREVYEELGGFDRRLTAYGEDWEMWVRIAAHAPIWHEVDPLALYRVHAASLSGQSVRSGANGADLRRAIALIAAYLPPAQARSITHAARRNFALACLRRAHRMLEAEGTHSVFAQLREALRTDRSLDVVSRAVFLGLRWSEQRLRRAAQVQN
jgi:hypothetical protein